MSDPIARQLLQALLVSAAQREQQEGDELFHIHHAAHECQEHNQDDDDDDDNGEAGLGAWEHQETNQERQPPAVASWFAQVEASQQATVASWLESKQVSAPVSDQVHTMEEQRIARGSKILSAFRQSIADAEIDDMVRLVQKYPCLTRVAVSCDKSVGATSFCLLKTPNRQCARVMERLLGLGASPHGIEFNCGGRLQDMEAADDSASASASASTSASTSTSASASASASATPTAPASASAVTSAPATETRMDPDIAAAIRATKHKYYTDVAATRTFAAQAPDSARGLHELHSSPLGLAVFMDLEHVVQLLMAKGADPTRLIGRANLVWWMTRVEGKDGDGLLGSITRAVSLGCTDIDSPDTLSNKTPLMVAIGTNQWAAASLLLKLGAKTTMLNPATGKEEPCRFPNGASLLCACIEAGNPITSTQLILSGQVDLDDARPGTGCTPLMMALKMSMYPIVGLLVLSGASVRARDALGRSALYYVTALKDSHLEMTKLLLNAGADPETADCKGMTIADHLELLATKTHEPQMSSTWTGCRRLIDEWIKTASLRVVPAEAAESKQATAGAGFDAGAGAGKV